MSSDFVDYPGITWVIQDFEWYFAQWCYLGAEYGKYQMKRVGIDEPTSTFRPLIEVSETFCSISCTYNKNSSFHQHDLINYAKRVGLEVRISQTNSYISNGLCSVQFFCRSYDTFFNCGLKRYLEENREYAQTLLPVALRFYDHHLIQDILQHEKNNQCYNPNIHIGGIRYPDSSDGDGYTFRNGPDFYFNIVGYRNLEDEDELAAFAIAYWARKTNCDLRRINFNGFMWNPWFEYEDYDYYGRGLGKLKGIQQADFSFCYGHPKKKQSQYTSRLKDFFE